MKKIVLIIAYFSYMPCCLSQVHSFNDIVLHGIYLTHHNPYAVFKVKSLDYFGWTVIPIRDLYDYFSKDRTINRDTFLTFISNELYDVGYLTILDTNIVQLGFQLVYANDTVSYYASKGKTLFLEHYFPKGTKLRGAISAPETASVIAQLFRWNIACQLGHEIPTIYLARKELLFWPVVARYKRTSKELINIFEIIFDNYLNLTPDYQPLQKD